jgi:hypothetical protein
VAIAKGNAPDWEGLGKPDGPGEVTLRLAKDDVPIKGRVVDLEGRPVAGARILVGAVAKRADGGDLKTWIEGKRKLERGIYERDSTPMKSLPAEALKLPTSLETEKDGLYLPASFTLVGQSPMVRQGRQPTSGTLVQPTPRRLS